MRTITFFNSRPKEREAVAVGDRAVVYVRGNIEHIERADDNGETRDEWRAVEYSAIVSAHGLVLDDALEAQIIAAETAKAAVRVRAIRDALLVESDPQMLSDRVEREDEEYVAAWKKYRQELRDLPQQPGFPFNVVYPEKPVR